MDRAIFVIVVLTIKTAICHSTFNGTNMEVQRARRSLTYPHGSIMQLSVGITVHPDIADATLNINFGVQQNVPLPSNITELEYPPTIRSARKLEAADLYKLIEFQLERYGFHGECLKRIICEISFSPFQSDGVFETIITRVLTPTILGNKNSTSTSMYSEAEEFGARGIDCSSKYSLCPTSPMEFFSRISDFS